MTKTFGGICDGCECGFSLTNALTHWKNTELLLCDDCTDVADHIGRGRVQYRMEQYGNLRGHDNRWAWE